MTKKIAVINDLSGFGRCSLTAAIPVISVMGVQPCPLPTAVLSAQTGYPSYYCDDYTDKMECFRQEWEKMGVSFDGIYTGYVASEEQIAHIFRFLDTFYKKETNLTETASCTGDSMPWGREEERRPFLLVDPVLGDEGKVYKVFTPKLLTQMQRLAERADIITPNLTELCLLTENDFHKLKAEKDTDCLIAAVEKMARQMMAKGVRSVVVTGIRFTDPADGREKVGNLVVSRETAEPGSLDADGSGGRIRSRLSAYPYVGGSFSGTGDLLASVLAGGTARGDDIFHSVELAGRFIGQAMEDAAAEGVERNAGANFERYLGMLISEVR